MRPSIGIDVGGTTSRVGLVDVNSRLLEAVRFATPFDLNALLENLGEAITPWFSRCHSPLDIGMALPGVIDPAKGIVARSVNLPWLENLRLCDLVEAKLGCSPALMTDADAATWGEYLAAGSPAAPLAHLRLGTGVACGVVADGRLVSTDPDRRTHWPLLVVEEGDDALICPCGLRGCLELYASGASMIRQARAIGFADLDQLRGGLLVNQERAWRIVDQAALSMCRAITNLAEKYGVAMVVIGGGVIGAIPQLVEHIVEALAKSACPHVQVIAANLGDDAGVIGAARLACTRPGQRESSNN